VRNWWDTVCGFTACCISCTSRRHGRRRTSQEHDNHTPSSLLPLLLGEQQNIVLHITIGGSQLRERALFPFFRLAVSSPFCATRKSNGSSRNLALKDVPWR
ncbi:unnamed protein product, partial [Ectocarpus fasciculatus]